jgi:hypothetical protein
MAAAASVAEMGAPGDAPAAPPSTAPLEPPAPLDASPLLPASLPLPALPPVVAFVPAVAFVPLVPPLPERSPAEPPYPALAVRPPVDLPLVAPRPPVPEVPAEGAEPNGPLLLTVRSALAPGLVRDVKDPLLTGAARNVGERTEPFFFLDGGLALSLTGEKAWRGLNPRLHTNIGMVASLNSEYDLGGYRFGPKFIWSWGGSVRGVRAGRFEWNADLTYALWRMHYPSSYGGDGSASDESILGDGALNPWNGNLILTFGVTRAFRR